MAYVGEQSQTRLHFFNQCQSLLKRHVRPVLLMSQGVDYQDFRARYQAFGAVGHRETIGDVAEIADTESRDLQVVGVHDRYWNRVKVEWFEPKRVPVYFVDVESWRTGIWMAAKAIWHALTDVASHFRAAIDRESTVAITIGSQIVESAKMVVVLVGDKQRCKLRASTCQNLSPEVGPTIDEKIFAGDLDQN